MTTTTPKTTDPKFIHIILDTKKELGNMRSNLKDKEEVFFTLRQFIRHLATFPTQELGEIPEIIELALVKKEGKNNWEPQCEETNKTLIGEYLTLFHHSLFGHSGLWDSKEEEEYAMTTETLDKNKCAACPKKEECDLLNDWMNSQDIGDTTVN